MTDAASTGTIHLDGDVATIAFTRRLAQAPEVVWAALTEPDQRAEWMGASTIEAREGGAIATDPDDPPAPAELKRMTGTILVWDPPRVLEHTWHQAIIGDGVVRYELAADGDGTLLTYTHRGMKPSDAEGYLPGTHAYLDRIEAHLAGAVVPGWWARYQELQAQYG